MSGCELWDSEALCLEVSDREALCCEVCRVGKYWTVKLYVLKRRYVKGQTHVLYCKMTACEILCREAPRCDVQRCGVLSCEVSGCEVLLKLFS